MLISYTEEKNRRQVPKVKDYLASKDYCDSLYCYLQVISEFDEDKKERYVLKKNCKWQKIGEDIDMCRQTVKNKFTKMLGKGLIKEDGDRYILINLENTIAELIPFPTLRVLVNTMKEKVISLYIYFLVRYRAEQQKSFVFTFTQIKNMLNIGASRSTDYIITDMLLVLNKLELIKYESKTERQNDGSIKTIYTMVDMTNKINDRVLAESMQEC